MEGLGEHRIQPRGHALRIAGKRRFDRSHVALLGRRRARPPAQELDAELLSGAFVIDYGDKLAAFESFTTVTDDPIRLPVSWGASQRFYIFKKSPKMTFFILGGRRQETTDSRCPRDCFPRVVEMATDTLHPFMRDDARGETSMRGDAPEVTSVTIVLTTSPCRSHPSTMLIEETVSSSADTRARSGRRDASLGRLRRRQGASEE